MEYIFDEVLEIKNGKNQKTVENPKGKYPIYSSGGIMGYADNYICEADTVIIGRKGSINNPIYVSEPFWNVDTAFGLSAKRECLLPRYLFYFCKKFNFEKLNKTVTVPSLTKSDLLKIKIELPDISIQKKVVDRLSKIEAIIERRKQELLLLDELIKARFVEMFGDPVSNTKGWKRVTIDECVDSIENGKSFVCDSMARIGEEPAILKLSAATYGVYKPEENKAIINESDFIEGAEVHSGDLLFTRKNTPELVGMAAYVFMTPKKLMMPDLIFRINTKQNCRKIYLWKLINHELFRSQIQNLASGSAKSMSNISKERLGKLHICLPPLDLQIEFEKFVIQINKSKVAVQKALDETQLLFDSLMQKYFG